MKRIATITLAVIVLIMISCKVSKSQRYSHDGDLPSASQTAAGQENLEKAQLLSTSSGSPAEAPQTPPADSSQPPAIALPKPTKKPVTQYNSQELDDRVREMASKLGVDPKTYRMPISSPDDEVQIFRMLGMHVIVEASGKEVFLPDEI